MIVEQPLALPGSAKNTLDMYANLAMFDTSCYLCTRPIWSIEMGCMYRVAPIIVTY